MTLSMIILGGLLLATGFIGCVVPVLPGPILAYAGLLCLLLTDKPPSVLLLVMTGLIVAVVTVADYVVPALGARKFKCSKWGTCGCFVGTVVGLFFLPVGLILGPFLGALFGELIAGKDAASATRGGIGALLGFLAGVAMKVLVCVILTVAFVLCLR